MEERVPLSYSLLFISLPIADGQQRRVETLKTSLEAVDIIDYFKELWIRRILLDFVFV